MPSSAAHTHRRPLPRATRRRAAERQPFPPVMTRREISRITDPVRLGALRSTQLMDSEPEESFDRITRLAARFLGTPLALVNLVDDRRQYAKSCVVPEGWPFGPEASMADSYCKWAVATGKVVRVTDARTDPRVVSSSFVTDPGLISYLGVPLATSEGCVLGSLCVAAFEPREWTDDDADILRDLAAAVSTEIELRRDLAQRRDVGRMKDQFVAVRSHERRTPLTSLRGALGLVDAGTLGPVPERAGQMVKLAVRNVERLVRMVNDILDLERLQAGMVELEPAWRPVDELAEQAIGAVRALADEAGVTVRGPSAPAMVYGDPDRVVQVLINLVTNAIKFSPRGSVVDVEAEHRECEVVLRVRDRGRGIPADQMEAVFDRFRQVDSSDARVKGGTGLGLPICRGIVEQHGGRIVAESEVGVGTTFIFSLPLPPACGA